MHEQSAHETPTVLRHVVRLVVLLGGAVLWWLLASNAPAHADDTVDSGTSRSSALADGADRADRAPARVERPASAVSTGIRQAPARISGTASAVTRSAPGPVRTTVAHLTEDVVPAVSRASDLVADTVDHTVRVVHSVVDPVLDSTAVAAPEAAPEAATEAATAPTPAHQTRTRDRSVPAGPRDLSPTSVTTAAVALDATPARSTPGAPFDSAQDEPAPRHPAAPVGSWSGPSGATATLAGMLLVLFLLIRGRRIRDDDDVPPGPTHLPGSSPD